MEWLAAFVSGFVLFGSGVAAGVIAKAMAYQTMADRKQREIADKQAYIRRLMEERKSLLWQNRIGRGL